MQTRLRLSYRRSCGALHKQIYQLLDIRSKTRVAMLSQNVCYIEIYRRPVTVWKIVRIEA